MLLRRIRDLILKRPLGYSLAGFLLVYFFCGFFNSYLKLSLSIVGFYITLILIIAKIVLNVLKSVKNPRLLPAILMIFAISLSFLLSWISFDLTFERTREKYHGKEAQVTLTVINAESMSDYYSSHEVIITEINGKKCSHKAILTSSYFNAYDNGDRIKLPAEISVNTEFSNLSQAYDLSRGIILGLSSESEENTEILEKDSIFPYSQMSALRKSISRIIGSFTNGEGASLSRALIYGDRSDLSYSFTSAFKELGISHMLAISGMHFSIVVGLLAVIFSKARINNKVSILLLSAFVILYTFIAGFSGSVCRAAIMLLFSYISLMFGRRSDAVTSLFCSVFLICLFSPYAIYDIGLLLSFFSTLGILILALPVNEKISKTKIRKIKPLYALISALNITLSATLFTLPICYFCFGYISYISPITNLIFAPLINLILYLLVIMILLSPIKAFAYALGYMITWLSEATVTLSSYLASTGNYYLHFEYLFSAVLLSLMLLSLVIMVIFLKNFEKHRELAYIPFLVFVIGCYIGNYIIIRPYLNGNSVTYYSEKENDAIIISSGGESILCDSSGGSYSFAKNAIEYGENHGKTDITTYMITDYHYTHIATVTKLVKYTDIRSFVLPVPQERDENYHNAITRFLYYSNCSVSFYTPGEEAVMFGEFTLTASIFAHDSANPASVILIESEKDLVPDYTYISNTRDLTNTNEVFWDYLTECINNTNYLICGSHGSSEKALAEIKGNLSCETIYDSFYSGLKE